MSGETRSVVVRLSMDTAQAIRASKEFGTEFGRAMDQAEKHTSSTRQAMDQLGGTAGKMALVAGAGLAAVIAKTANFDEAMSHVAATGDDARGSLEALRAAAIQAGADTVFSASEAAGGIENLAKAGVSAKDILAGGLKGSLDLAAAGGLEVADAAEVAATALTQFKLQGQDVPHVADLLAAAAGKAQGDVSDMAMALKQSGLVASQMGLSLEETTGTLAAFASAGLLGSDAGTSFRTMLLRLANPTNQSRNLMDSLGIATYDAQGKFVGMAAVAGQLQSALQNKTQAERDSALATIFGSDAIRAASVLYAQGAPGIEDWTGKVDDAGYAAKTAATRMDNLKGDLEQFRGSLETALIGAGEGSQGPLRSLVQNATKMVNVFNDAPPAIQGTLTKLLAITAVTGGAAWFGSKVIRGISDTRKALDNLGFSADGTRGRLALLAGKGGALLAVGTAVGAIADQIGRIDSSNLDRSLEALSRGEVTGDIEGVVKSLSDVTSKLNAVDLGEVVTLFGAFGDSSLDKAADNIDQMDQALAQMVESGNAAQAADMFAQITALAEKSGVSADDTAGRFDAYALAVRNASGVTDGWGGIISSLGDNALQTASAFGNGEKATGDFGVAMRKAAADAKVLRDDMAASREEARKTASSFIGLGDGLDDSKVSLDKWLHQLEQQNEALRNFRRNAQDAADKGLRRGLIDALQEAGPAGALRMKQLANATESEIGRANKAWAGGRAEMKRYVDFKVPPKTIEIDTSQAKMAIDDVQARLAGLHSKTIAIDIATGGGPGHSAGGYTGDGGKFQPAGYVHRGEFVFSKEATDGNVGMLAALHSQLRGYAGGGLVGYADGGPVRSLDDRLEIAGILQQIRDMQQQLGATVKKGDHKGEHQVRGLDRQVLLLQLEAAERDLRRAKHADEREAAQAAREQRHTRRELAGSMGALFDGIIPAAPQTVAQQVAATISDFRKQWLAAGGEWTKELRAWAQQTRAAAAQYDANAAAIDAETQRRDALEQTLTDQQSQLEQLNSTMAAYHDAVAGNFLSDPFHDVTVDPSKGPNAVAIAAAKAQLAALQATKDASAATAAQASRVMQQIAALQDSTSTDLTGVDALRYNLTTDTQNAQDFTAALQTLASKGLDTTGDFGGLYQQLASSGDFVTAEQLAQLSADQIDEYEKLFKAREDAAATVASQATQAVYGAQEQRLESEISQTNGLISAATAAIELLTAVQSVLGDEVRGNAAQTAVELHPDLVALKASVDALPGNLQHLIRQGGGR